MNIKPKLFLNQLIFLRPLVGFLILLALLYVYGLADFTKLFQTLGIAIPHWVIYGIYAFYGLYACWRLFVGIIIWLNNRRIKRAKSFFGLLKNNSPAVTVNNVAEQYALLATLFYETTHILLYDKAALPMLEKNADYIPPYRQNKAGQIIGGSQFINSIEGFPLEQAEDLRQGLKESLRLSWGVTDKASAWEQMNALWENANAGAEFDLLASQEGRRYAQAVCDFGFAFAPRDLPINASAFAVVRFVYLARSAFSLGYLEESEVRSALFSAATFIAHHYKDWQHFAYSYLINFVIWHSTIQHKSLAYGAILESVLGANQALASPASPLQGSSLAQLREQLKPLIEQAQQEEQAGEKER